MVFFLNYLFQADQRRRQQEQARNASSQRRAAAAGAAGAAAAGGGDGGGGDGDAWGWTDYAIGFLVLAIALILYRWAVAVFPEFELGLQ